MPDGRTKKRADEGNDCCPQKGVEQDVEAGNQARMAEVVDVNQNKYNKADSHTGPGKVFDGAEMRLNHGGDYRRHQADHERQRKKVPASHCNRLAGQAESSACSRNILVHLCLRIARIMRNHASRILGSAVPSHVLLGGWPTLSPAFGGA